jgi:hypothetical protein
VYEPDVGDWNVVYIGPIRISGVLDCQDKDRVTLADGEFEIRIRATD